MPSNNGQNADAAPEQQTKSIRLKLQEILIELDQMGACMAAIHVNSAIEALSAIDGD